MQISHTHHEPYSLLAAAKSLQLTFQEVEKDLCFFPFSDDDTAQILGVLISDLQFLHEHSILERTCLPSENASGTDPACSYWDMFNATVCMSLLAAGVSIPDAHEIAFLLFDVIADNGERDIKAGVLDYTKLLGIVGWLLADRDSGFDLRRSPYTVHAIAMKVVVDLLYMHQRCLRACSLEFGWLQ
jgi:hypothetical protein